MLPRRLSGIVVVSVSLGALPAGLFAIDEVQAQGEPPPARKHRANQVQPATLIPASEPAPGVSKHSVKLENAARRILANLPRLRFKFHEL